MKYCIALAISAAILIGCKQQSSNTGSESDAADTTKTEEAYTENLNGAYAPASVDDAVAADIASFLVNEYLAGDLPIIDSSDRVFQLYKVDLNDDGNDEVFVRFMSRYFCGSGGCTLLLLDKYGGLITKFTVIRPPVFVEPAKRNGWSVLLVEDAGVFKELVFDNGTYPSNPSVLEKAPYDAPSGHAEIMFSGEFSPAKTYTF